jgi:MFS family permease
MMADYFPREKLPRAIAVLQIGYIAGGALSLILGGAAIRLVSDWADVVVPGIGVIHNWQFVFIIVGLPGLLVALLMRSVPEPARRGRMMHGVTAAMPIGQVVGYLFRHWRVYAPMFLGLAVSAIEVLGTMQWRIAFFQRSYGWSPSQAANASAPAVLIGSAIGLVFGTWLCETLARRYDDANMRAVAILYTISFPFSIAGPLMPTPWLAVLCSAVGAMCGIAGAIPQNAAVQSVTPNEMRGQVTALYLFVFTVLGGGFGPTFIAFITDHILGDESLLRYSMAGSAAIMGPLATIIMWLGVRPYGHAIAEVKERERLDRIAP